MYWSVKYAHLGNVIIVLLHLLLDPIECPGDSPHAGRSLGGMGREHLGNQHFQCSAARLALQAQRSEANWAVRGVLTREQEVQQCAQTVDIRLGSGLGTTILFRSRIAWRAKALRIPGLSRLIASRNPKIDQVQLASERAQNVARFEITEDNGRLATVQVV
jgi:hypothetical protein